MQQQQSSTNRAYGEAVVEGSLIRYNNVQCHLDERLRLMKSVQVPTYNWISFKQDFDVLRLFVCLLRFNVILAASKTQFLMKYEICFNTSWRQFKQAHTI